MESLRSGLLRKRWQKKRSFWGQVYDVICCIPPPPKLRGDFETAMDQIPQGSKRIFVEFHEIEWPIIRERQIELEEALARQEEAKQGRKLRAKQQKIYDKPPV